MTGCAGDRDRQRADRRGLVDHDQQRSVLGELGEQGSQLGFAVGQRPVMKPCAIRRPRYDETYPPGEKGKRGNVRNRAGAAGDRRGVRSTGPDRIRPSPQIDDSLSQGCRTNPAGGG